MTAPAPSQESPLLDAYVIERLHAAERQREGLPWEIAKAIINEWLPPKLLASHQRMMVQTMLSAAIRAERKREAALRAKADALAEAALRDDLPVAAYVLGCNLAAKAYRALSPAGEGG